MKRLGHMIAVALFAALTLLAGCGSSSTPSAPGSAPAPAPKPADPAPTKLDFGGSFTWYGQVPIMVAVDKGYFKEQGLDVTFQSIPSSADRLKALAAGSIAFSNLGRVSVITDMARGNESFYYFTNIDDSPGNEGVWAKPGINSIKDLKGKKVTGNSSAEITLYGLLQANNMTMQDIQYQSMGASDMPLALRKGDIDAASIWQPVLGELKKAQPEGKLLGLDTDTEIYQKFKTASAPDIVIISRQLVDKYPEQAKKLAAALFKGAAYANNNPEDTAKTVAHYFQKTPEEVLAGLKTFHYFDLASQAEHMKLHEAQMEYLAKWLADNKLIDKQPDVHKWAKYDFLPKP